MRLSTLVPSISQEIVTLFENNGIVTDRDLLFNESALDIYQKLPREVLTLSQLRAFIARVTELLSASGSCSADLPDIPRLKLLTGVANLDALTDGFASSQIVEISGDSASGKTTFALNLAVRYLQVQRDSIALWIDTRGEFSPERAYRTQASMDHEASDVLDRLQVSEAFEIEAVYEVLWALPMSQQRFGCIFIDSITPLLGSNLSAVSSQGHAIMSGFMQQLRALAQSLSLTVFVINNATALRGDDSLSAFEWTAKKPALGPSFSFMSDSTLWLSKCHDRDDAAMYTAEMLRSRSTHSSTWTRFRICDGVLKSA
ncbi:P-loop containing nucleoside triphosphate hydrolase protein [Guyanagaster necrorhizus]|uniref:P-loop containing nucleoside triphosphate hydrolase protein n=1 Tax=Guyanagaster necrorhizus TaxID=856835 RepID=A0A9P8AYI3_9AGAR|nr:P-loop containing nucleoside triphosphate hydrolase protein [Guyanagaster necrorhizus MCA 3950]KAG7450952.1 P-loop containing nucleoside triphosphate hydrolase protein [Guyanagaster necrorhizus MCA 3950]